MIVLELVAGERLGPISLGMTRTEAAAALEALGPVNIIRRGSPEQRPVLATCENGVQVFFGDDDRVSEVEVSARVVDASLGAIHLLSTPAPDVLRQAAVLFGEQPASAERGTSFVFAGGLRLWRAVCEADCFTTALVFRPDLQEPIAPITG